jgi:hypothetical protein
VPSIIQTTTIGGTIIEKARWEIEDQSLIREGHGVYLEFPSTDEKLVFFISNLKSMDCNIDIEDKKYTIVLNCLVKNIKHMLNTQNGKMETMIITIPANRIVENVLLYVLDIKKCDPKFIKLVRDGNN